MVPPPLDTSKMEETERSDATSASPSPYHVGYGFYVCDDEEEEDYDLTLRRFNAKRRGTSESSTRTTTQRTRSRSGSHDEPSTPKGPTSTRNFRTGEGSSHGKDDVDEEDYDSAIRTPRTPRQVTKSGPSVSDSSNATATPGTHSKSGKSYDGSVTPKHPTSMKELRTGSVKEYGAESSSSNSQKRPVSMKNFSSTSMTDIRSGGSIQSKDEAESSSAHRRPVTKRKSGGSSTKKDDAGLLSPNPGKQSIMSPAPFLSPGRSSMKKTNSKGRGLRHSTTALDIRIRGKEEPIRRNVSVDFSSRVHVQKVVPLTDLAEPNEIWLQGADLAKIKETRRKDVRKFLQLLEETSGGSGSPSGVSNSGGKGSASTIWNKLTKGSNNNESGSQQEKQSNPDPTIDAKKKNKLSSYRGLERFVEKESMRKCQMDSLEMVLAKQAELLKKGKYNEDQIAKVYSKATTEANDIAIQRAKQDASDIETYLLSPRTQKLVKHRPTGVTAPMASAVCQ